MKRRSSVFTFSAIARSLPVIALCAVPAAATVKAEADPLGGGVNYFYSTSGPGGKIGTGELFAIKVRGEKVTTTDIGPLDIKPMVSAGNCASLAQPPGAYGVLYSVCGPLFGPQYLATINPTTGTVTPVSSTTVSGLAVMALAFAPNGVLYAVGGCIRSSSTGDCDPSAPGYNSLYTVNIKSGAFTPVRTTATGTPVGTGAPMFFMDLAFDRDGTLYGVTTTLPATAAPAILYRIDLGSGKATMLTNLVGSTRIMGLAFGQGGKLYATDFVQNPGLYLIDIETGFMTAIGALCSATAPLCFPFSSSLELANPH